VNDIPAGKPASRGDHRFVYLASTLPLPYLHTLFQNGWPTRTMNGSIHAPASRQRSVGRVDDRADLELRDVASQQLYVVYHSNQNYETHSSQKTMP